MATRFCSHIRQDGTRCGAPALRRKSLCKFHQSLADREKRRLEACKRLGITNDFCVDLPSIEDRASAMIAINEVLQCLALGLIDRITARTHLFAIRLALTTIKHTALLPDFLQPEEESGPSMCEAFLAKLAEIPLPSPDDSTPIPQIHASIDEKAPDLFCAPCSGASPNMGVFPTSSTPPAYNSSIFKSDHPSFSPAISFAVNAATYKTNVISHLQTSPVQLLSIHQLTFQRIALQWLRP
jgi:hypothetical protein